MAYAPENIIIYTYIPMHTDIQAYINIDSVYLITSFYEMLSIASQMIFIDMATLHRGTD